MNAIEVRDVAFAYGGREVLRGVSFDAAEGEMTGVVGPNGSGKTTLIGLVCGLLRPRSGEIRVGGVPVAAYDRRELSRRVAVVPQAAGTVFPYTVEEVVAMGRYPHLRWPGWLSEGDRGICATALRRTRTEEFAGRTLDHLSAGERQRVLIARALAQGARIILLDEASSFLDLGQEIGIFRMLDELRREEGLTFLTVSHDLNLVGAFCQKAVLLREGRILAAGALDGAYTGENLSALFGVTVRTDAAPGGRVRVSW